MPLRDTLKRLASRLTPRRRRYAQPLVPGAIGNTGYVISHVGPSRVHLMFPSKRGAAFDITDLPPRATRDEPEAFILAEALRRASLAHVGDLLRVSNHRAFIAAVAVERRNMIGGA